MRVLQVITALHKGGAEAHLLSLARAMRARDVDVEVAFLRAAVPGGSLNLRQAFEDAGIRTHYLHAERAFDPRSATRLRALLASGGWDLVHSHLPRADAAAASCRMLDARMTWVSTIHDPYDGAYSGARFIPLVAPLWRRADGIIAVSEPLREWAVKTLGVPAQQVRTIVHGIDPTPHPAPLPPEATAAGGGRFCIGSIGRYEERKGHETLIRAMATVVQHVPHARLRIAGHDPFGHGASLRALIAELGLDAHVELIGYISDRERFFSSIDVFAFASLWEGFGIVVLEAMDAGRPAVVSDISPLKDIIVPGESGLVARRQDPASFAEALLTLYRDRDLLRRLAEAGRHRAATEFSHARMVERTIDYYDEVLRRRRRQWAVPGTNFDPAVIDDFGSEWQRFDQRALDQREGLELFNRYFSIFPWNELPADASGFDAGCGSGRWARFVAPRVARLHCVDASPQALEVAAANLAGFANCELHLATVDSMPIADGSADFGYALGVLHHIPDTMSALRACVGKLKPGAPLLLYMYYRFENRPTWFPKLWKASDLLRSLLSRAPFSVKSAASGLLAVTLYWPVARAARWAERAGVSVEHIPLSAYRNSSLYVMRTDALDRFGTRLEKRFTRTEIRHMMEEAGLTDVRFHEGPPYWVAMGRRRAAAAAADLKQSA